MQIEARESRSFIAGFVRKIVVELGVDMVFQISESLDLSE